VTDSPHEPTGDDGPAEGRHLPVPAAGAQLARGEVVDPSRGLLERLSAGPLAGPALAAAGGFLVGFVTFLTARLLRGPGGRRLLARRRRRTLERQIESSRSFLVDVHVLRR
jgi:hypothetical protein